MACIGSIMMVSMLCPSAALVVTSGSVLLDSTGSHICTRWPLNFARRIGPDQVDHPHRHVATPAARSRLARHALQKAKGVRLSRTRIFKVSTANASMLATPAKHIARQGRCGFARLTPARRSPSRRAAPRVKVSIFLRPARMSAKVSSKDYTTYWENTWQQGLQPRQVSVLCSFTQPSCTRPSSNCKPSAVHCQGRVLVM